jgi:hypothetical protein
LWRPDRETLKIGSFSTISWALFNISLTRPMVPKTAPRHQLENTAALDFQMVGSHQPNSQPTKRRETIFVAN